MNEYWLVVAFIAGAWAGIFGMLFVEGSSILGNRQGTDAEPPSPNTDPRA